MSEVNVPAANPTQATSPLEQQAQPKGSEAPNPNMTGEEAKAWVEAQKAAKEGKTKAPPAAAAPKADPVTSNTIKEAIEQAKKYKVKVDGQELEVEEAELLRGYSHQRAASKALQEGKAAKQQAEDFVKMMRDPEKFFEVAAKLGHDPRLLAEKYVAAQLEEEFMDPRDKELRDAKKKLKTIEEMEAQQKAAVEAQRNEALKQKYAEDYTKQFTEALQESGLPATKPMVAEMAKYIARAAGIGFQMTAKEASQLVKEDVLNAHKRLIGDTDGEVLIKLLGEDVANKVRKWDTSRLKSPEQNLKTPTEQQPGRERTKRTEGKRMSAAEWREYNRR